ncbi:hypothetical protein [Bradyrhizobium sp. McL0616]|uniref:hypothetical protein n=1 Tax=Bradyrhizobium sp. McL0616 TaxID=3415674 RepID=UPI003CF0294F
MLRLKEATPVSRDLNIGQIDTAELLLHRVYAFGAPEGHARGMSVGQDAAGWERAEMAVLQAEIDTQRQIIKLLRNEVSDLKKERDAWRSRATRLCRSVSTDLTATPRPGSFSDLNRRRQIALRRGDRTLRSGLQICLRHIHSAL